ncbi:MAG: helix-turn-helix transcriptional regulator [Acidimicrobiia bacterium]|nr:helix-turn-helix transcriptional regulator [Acidimicrobiia bacterium]
MPATSAYEMLCPIARALDVLGDRWTLLIVRDLALGEQRFTDLKRAIVGIPPNVLSARLKALVAAGVVTTKDLPPPAARTVYVLTPRGREALPIIRALARWGFPELEEVGPSSPLEPVTVVGASYIPFYDRAAAAGIEERYVLEIDGLRFWLSSVPGERPDGKGEADLVLDGPSWAFVAARQGGQTLDDLVDAGVIRRTKGSARTQRHFARVFSLPTA